MICQFIKFFMYIAVCHGLLLNPVPITHRITVKNQDSIKHKWGITHIIIYISEVIH